MRSATAHLDDALFAVVGDLPGVLAPLTIVGDGTRTLPLFTAAASADAHRAALPAAVRGRWTTARLAADDWRAKAEILAAAGAAGATDVGFDPDLDLAFEVRTPLEMALAYAASHRTGTACL